MSPAFRAQHSSIRRAYQCGQTTASAFGRLHHRQLSLRTFSDVARRCRRQSIVSGRPTIYASFAASPSGASWYGDRRARTAMRRADMTRAFAARECPVHMQPRAARGSLPPGASFFRRHRTFTSVISYGRPAFGIGMMIGAVYLFPAVVITSRSPGKVVAPVRHGPTLWACSQSRSPVCALGAPASRQC